MPSETKQGISDQKYLSITDENTVKYLLMLKIWVALLNTVEIVWWREK